MPRLTLTNLVYVVLACFAIMRAGQPGPPSDVWWQMSTGRYIVQHGALPTEDIFTFTHAGWRRSGPTCRERCRSARPALSQRHCTRP